MGGRFQQVDASERSSFKFTQDDTYGKFKCSTAISRLEESRCSDGGALQDGGVPKLFSSESCGLLVQYAAVGLMMGALPSAVTPFLSYYLNMEGQATTSARALLGIPWSVKVFIGIISDCFPINGYRRRPYMTIGWILCSLCLVTMAALPPEKPYFPEA